MRPADQVLSVRTAWWRCRPFETIRQVCGPVSRHYSAFSVNEATRAHLRRRIIIRTRPPAGRMLPDTNERFVISPRFVAGV